MPDVVQHVHDRVRLGLDFVDQLALGVDGDDPLVGLGDAGQQHVDLVLQRRHLAAVLGDVLQVGPAARADLGGRSRLPP